MRGLLRFLLWTAILTGTVIGLLRLVAIRWVRLPTDDPIFETSVMPSLFGGDLIVLWRLGEPTFGDLVLCPEPDYPERYIIGRVLGLAGDRVEIDNGEPRVNGDKFQWERTCDPTYFYYPHPDDPDEEVKQQCEMENVAGHLHQTGITAGHKVAPEDREYDVPEGKFFLVSDNRLFPYDSRDYGFVDVDSCGEMVFLRLVSRKGWSDSENRFDYIP